MRERDTKTMDESRAEDLAVRALGALASEEDRLWRFLDLSGLTPDGLRSAASQPGFAAAVLDHVSSDEELLVWVAQALGERPETLARAQAVLSPPPFDF